MSDIPTPEKIKYFKIALGLVGVNTDDRTCDIIIATYERLMKLGADFSVHDAVAIQMENERKYPAKDTEK
jgi:hypothetical protein